MGWGKSNALRKPEPEISRVEITPDVIDWERLVTLDLETYWDINYTLSKLSTSEYIRDKRFKAQMVGIKIGSRPTRIYTGAGIAKALNAVPWQTHTLLAHHAQFDGFILAEKYGIQPKKIYCTLSMVRGLYSSDIGAGLDEASKFFGGQGKIEGALDVTKGLLVWPKSVIESVGKYCANDVEECLRIFKCMHPMMPVDEMDFIDIVCRMFTDPVLKVDIPRVKKELAREIEAKRVLMLSVAELAKGEKLDKKQLGELGPDPTEEAIAIHKAKKLIGSARFADLLRAEGVKPPTKISPAWIATPKAERDEAKKWAYAFAKTDLAFVQLQEHPSERVRELVEARLSVKSNTNETRAGRFLEAGKNGSRLPVYYKYAAAITHRLGGGNKMNMQNLTRGGELRKSILADTGHMLAVLDSGQIEARTNGWLWGQDDLMKEFRQSDAGLDKDPYCKFADIIYGRPIVKSDEEQRFVGKVGILGLGYQMGAERFQNTLALGTMGKPVHMTLEQCEHIVYAYRRKNSKIKEGWAKCQQILAEMSRGIEGSHKCISWGQDTLYLPNGLVMRYPGLRDKRVARQVARALNPDIYDPEDEDQWDRPEFVYDNKGVETKIYGGKLCENIVQALARIIVMKQTLVIAKKHRLVMSTHDEAVLHVKKAIAQKAYDFGHKEFSTPLPWCADLPLNADGKIDVFYSK